MKQIPLGTEDFKEIIEKNNYYVDKTKSIELIEQFGTSRKVILFTRPRRFGKTLFMSTLKYFYDIENKDENKKLFKGLYMESSPLFKVQGAYPVISLTMKSIESDDIQTLMNKILNNLVVHINKIKTFTNLTDSDEALLKRLDSGDKATLEEALLHISRFYYEHYHKKVVILIDEYEAPLLNALQKGCVKEVISFFSSFYSSALKTNPYLEKGILTGITRISQASIFSGLNNFIVYDYNKNDFSDTFGFTQEEVNQALKYYNLEPNKEAIKEYYDGYLFGESEIYNPWSILNFLVNKKLDFYWTNTSNVKLIEDLLYEAPIDIKQTYIELAKGIEVNYDDANFDKLVLEDLNDPERLFDFMIVSGYLNYNQLHKKIRIVNKEVLHSLPEMTKKSLFYNNKAYLKFKKGIIAANEKNIENGLNFLMQDVYSYFDFPEHTNESNYHIALATILAISGIGEVKSNQEAGLGRFDIGLINNNPERYSYIIEVKRANNKNEMDNLIESSIKKIEEKKYLNFLKNQKYKAIICFCFYQKEVKVKLITL